MARGCSSEEAGRSAIRHGALRDAGGGADTVQISGVDSAAGPGIALVKIYEVP